MRPSVCFLLRQASGYLRHRLRHNCVWGVGGKEKHSHTEQPLAVAVDLSKNIGRGAHVWL